MKRAWQGAVAGMLMAVGVGPAVSWAVGGGACVVTTSCQPSAPVACGKSGPGTNNCGSCTAYGSSAGSCTPLSPLACGTSGLGTNKCGESCNANGPTCPNPWQRYGFAVPDDPVYHFGLPSNDTKDMLALAAKGNIVIGDYTSNEFAQDTLPLLSPPSPSNKKGTTQPYVIDPTDASLGYFSYAQGGKQYFNGDYTGVDENGQGKKLDAGGQPVGPRRFYESTLPDADFKKLVATCADPNNCSGTVQATLFTNHALTGHMPWTTNIDFFGAVVSRDDALSHRAKVMRMAHDIRLLKAGQSSTLTTLTLPFGIKRPKLMVWEECPASGCPPLP